MGLEATHAATLAVFVRYPAADIGTMMCMTVYKGSDYPMPYPCYVTVT